MEGKNLWLTWIDLYIYYYTIQVSIVFILHVILYRAIALHEQILKNADNQSFRFEQFVISRAFE